MSFLVRSVRASACAGWSSRAIARAGRIYLRPAQAQAPCIQHRRSPPACDPGYAKSRELDIDEAILACHF